MTHDLAKATGGEVQYYRDPVQVLQEATHAAKELKKIIDAKPDSKKFKIRGEVFLEFPDWQTVASFYQHTVMVKQDKFVDYSKAIGFEAEAVVLDPEGKEVSSAWAMCLNDEENWGKRPVYEWQFDNEAKKRVKVKIREEQVPLFQLRSMAQTRACAKALRNRFSWVVVLAGYSPTPAEEMTGGAGEQETTDATGKRHPDGTRLLSEGMRKKIHAVLGEMGINDTTEEPTARKDYCSKVIGGEKIESFEDLSFEEARKLIDGLESRAEDARKKK